MVLEAVFCPACGEADVVKHPKSAEGKQRYKCCHPDCTLSTFI
ncbi:IS1 family transposase [Leptolyngbya sp. FACHB-16]|nr:IS1 family transposase [Leptolyngbya sp. FACHB-16]